MLTWRDENNALVDLTGYTAEMDIRSSVGHVDTILELNTTNGRITLGGAAGTITLFISATDTDALTGWTAAVYDLELTRTSDGFVTRLVQGNVVLSPQITDD